MKQPSLVYSERLASFSRLVHGVSTRRLGGMKFYQKLVDEEVLKSRQRLAQALGIQLKNVVAAELAHFDNIYQVTTKDRGRGAYEGISAVPKTDALATGERDIFLLVTVADCLAILYYDPVKQVVGVAHVGWRSLLKELPAKVVNFLHQKFQVEPRDLVNWLSPAIGPCHFELPQEIAQKFAGNFYQQQGKYYVDLKAAAKDQLLKAGVKEENIEISPLCTVCQGETFSSYRREGESREPQAAVIGLRK